MTSPCLDDWHDCSERAICMAHSGPCPSCGEEAPVDFAGRPNYPDDPYRNPDPYLQGLPIALFQEWERRADKDKPDEEVEQLLRQWAAAEAKPERAPQGFVRSLVLTKAADEIQRLREEVQTIRLEAQKDLIKQVLASPPGEFGHLEAFKRAWEDAVMAERPEPIMEGWIVSEQIHGENRRFLLIATEPDFPEQCPQQVAVIPLPEEST